MRELLRQLTQSLEEGRETLLCQVVETRGSTPQKAGALMLVLPDGGQVGTLGGGCVEAEVKQRAIRRLGREGAELQSFLLDHDYAWADGLICGGRMVILAESFRGDASARYFRAYREHLESGLGFTEAIALDPERTGAERLGSRSLHDSEGRLVAQWPDDPKLPDPSEWITPLEERPRPLVRQGWATLPTLPRIRLVVVGAGHIGQAVAELAAQADFDVWVVDDRRQFANPERCPSASRHIVGPFDDVLPALDVTPQTYALIMTRGHGHDQEALYHLAKTAAPYVGLIGSRRKIKMIFNGLREMGITEEQLARVSSPVGLPIGSDTVPEIAVSIVAELIARRNLGPTAAVGNAFAQEREPSPV